MSHIVDSMLAEAAEAITAMREAALRARSLHARAELMRHMRSTAAKFGDRPLDEAVDLVTHEWLKAWGLGDHPDGRVREAAEAFTRAFCRDVRGSTAATQAEIEVAMAGLETAFGRIGTSVPDEMAFRSECAHGWWAAIVPRTQDARPFWAAGAPPHCMTPESLALPSAPREPA